MQSTEKIKSRWTRAFLIGSRDTFQEMPTYICDICHKDLGSHLSLTLHKNTHMVERPYKCEPCQVSFNTPGHLTKHERSSIHLTRVTMTQAFGVPTHDNPRPYGCNHCDVAFRKYGHLAKHLRSKAHMLKLENNGTAQNQADTTNGQQ